MRCVQTEGCITQFDISRLLSTVRKSITMRFDPDLLAKARVQAARENRTLTNFIETVVRQRVADPRPAACPVDAPAAKASAAAPPVADQDL